MASFDAYQDSIDDHALNFVHQLGHFAGLAHPTEATGDAFDLLSDTLECPVAQFDGNDDTVNNIVGTADGLISDSECGAQGGADNFMFFASQLLYGPHQITQEQAGVLLAHPLLYP